MQKYHFTKLYIKTKTNFTIQKEFYCKIILLIHHTNEKPVQLVLLDGLSSLNRVHANTLDT